MLIAAKSMKEITTLKAQLSSEFEMKDWIGDLEADHLLAKCNGSYCLSERRPGVTHLCDMLAAAHAIPCRHLLVASPKEVPE
jgi:hypothetical protein